MGAAATCRRRGRVSPGGRERGRPFTRMRSPNDPPRPTPGAAARAPAASSDSRVRPRIVGAPPPVRPTPVLCLRGRSLPRAHLAPRHNTAASAQHGVVCHAHPHAQGPAHAANRPRPGRWPLATAHHDGAWLEGPASRPGERTGWFGPAQAMLACSASPAALLALWGALGPTHGVDLELVPRAGPGTAPWRRRRPGWTRGCLLGSPTCGSCGQPAHGGNLRTDRYYAQPTS
jgi:hypothetical protein